MANLNKVLLIGNLTRDSLLADHNPSLAPPPPLLALSQRRTSANLPRDPDLDADPEDIPH